MSWPNHHPGAPDAAPRRARAEEALETGAGALLALEVLRNDLELLGGLAIVEESINRAIHLVRASLDELHRGLPGGEPALGFVSAGPCRPDEPEPPSRTGD